MWYSKFAAVDTAAPVAATNQARTGIASMSGNLVVTSQTGGSDKVTLSNFAIFGNVTQRDVVDAVIVRLLQCDRPTDGMQREQRQREHLPANDEHLQRVDVPQELLCDSNRPHRAESHPLGAGVFRHGLAMRR